MPTGRNILLILTSGHRGDGLGAAGVWPIDTPHLDQLAANGLALTTICASPEPLAAQVSLLTGLYPRQHGVYRGDQAPAIDGWAGAFRQAGWFTAGVGCVGPIARHMVESRPVAALSVLEDERCAYLKAMKRAGLIEKVIEQRQARRRTGPFGLASPMERPEDDIDGYIGEVGCAMIARLPRDEPWILTVAFSGPGNDLAAPDIYRGLIDPAKMPARFEMPDLRELDRLARFDYPRTFLQHLDPSGLRRIQMNYLARVCLIDCLVGMLRDALDRSGHARDTWIVLASDRGMVLGEGGVVGATSFAGSGVYGPLWVLPPAGVGDREAAGDPELRAVDGLVSSVDLCPTLCDIAGIDGPSGGVGQSVLPGIGGGRVGREIQISEYDHRLLMETLSHKAIFDCTSGSMQRLVDMVKDPDERQNLLQKPEGASIADALKWRLADELMRLRPVYPLSEDR